VCSVRVDGGTKRLGPSFRSRIKPSDFGFYRKLGWDYLRYAFAIRLDQLVVAARMLAADAVALGSAQDPCVAKGLELLASDLAYCARHVHPLAQTAPPARQTLRLEFEGWFQCRLATNPDHPDDPWGCEGYTFALPDEGRLDKIIRLQPHRPRLPGPSLGVTVKKVFLNDVADPKHDLIGAKVDLLGDPIFAGRNDLIVPEEYAFVHPLCLEIKGNGIHITASDKLIAGSNLSDDDQLRQAGPVELTRRRATAILHPLEVLRTAGLASIDAKDPNAVVDAFRARRRGELHAVMAGGGPAGDAAERRLRKAGLTISGECVDQDDYDPRFKALMMVAFQCEHELIGKKEVVSGPIDADVDGTWKIRLWFGAWDADALAGYATGSLTLPITARVPANPSTPPP
jgi:hypothetical protein